MRTWIQSCLDVSGRVWAVASVTFTQLARMKIFWAPAILGALFLLLQGVRFHDSLGPEVRGVYELSLIKSTAVGGMRLFGLLVAVAATALLVPRDAEDRILYTILCKPVPRISYLMGKALGVVFLLGATLVGLDLLMVGVLEVRTATVVAEQTRYLLDNGYRQDELPPLLDAVRAQGATWNLQLSLLVMFFEWCILVSLTLLFSCFTSGTLVSMFFSCGFYLIGSFQNQLFQVLTSGMEGVSDLVIHAGDLFALIVPNFQAFAVFDPGAAGLPLPLALAGNLALVAAAYFVFHLLLASWIFSQKEF